MDMLSGSSRMHGLDTSDAPFWKWFAGADQRVVQLRDRI